jgi:uncharacterized integral membrane protein
MKNILTGLICVAAVVLVVGVASHGARVDVNYVAGTWHHASLLALAAIVAGLLLAVGLAAAIATRLGAARDRDALEEELQRTYVRLRAAETLPQAEAAALPVPPRGDLPTGSS